MKIGTIRDGAAPRPAIVEGDRAYRLDDLLRAMGGVPVTVPDGVPMRRPCSPRASFWSRRGQLPMRFPT